MSFVNQANLREYWKPLYGCQLIQDPMLLYTFEKNKKHLYILMTILKIIIKMIQTMINYIK